MSTYVMRQGKIVEKGGPEDIRETKGSAPYIQSDYLPPLVHPANGKTYDSKSRFRAETKARGLTEIGNDKQRDTRNFDTLDVKCDISKSITELGG